MYSKFYYEILIKIDLIYIYSITVLNNYRSTYLQINLLTDQFDPMSILPYCPIKIGLVDTYTNTGHSCRGIIGEYGNIRNLISCIDCDALMLYYYSKSECIFNFNNPFTSIKDSIIERCIQSYVKSPSISMEFLHTITDKNPGAIFDFYIRTGEFNGYILKITHTNTAVTARDAAFIAEVYISEEADMEFTRDKFTLPGDFGITRV